MHEMRKSETVQHHHPRHVDGRREIEKYGMHKVNEHHKSSNSSQINKSERDHRASKSHSVTSQIPGAIRICGDWSEHISSNGKVYFFHNKTKVSQWERPAEWSSSRTVEVKQKDKAKTTAAIRGNIKHPSNGSIPSSGQQSRQQHKGYSQVSDVKKTQQQHNRHRPNHEGEGSKDRDYRTLSANSAKDRDYRDVDYRDAGAPRTNDGRVSNSSESRLQQRLDRDYRSSSNSTQDRASSKIILNSHRHTSQSPVTKDGSKIIQTGYDSLQRHNRDNFKNSNSNHTANENLRHQHSHDGTDHSSTPKSMSDSQKGGRQAVPRGSVESNVSSEAANDNDDSSTSALVQTLSNVLSQASTSSEKNSTDSSIEGNLKNALQMLIDVAVRNQHITGNSGEKESPKAETSQEEPATKRLKCSSDPVDEYLRNTIAASQKSESSLNLLRSAFDDRLSKHVQGWPMDHIEKQSNRLSDECHRLTVNHTSQICVSMKIARSQVRAAEIHSTVQEQRILYLRQQIKDLEKSTTMAPYT